MKQIATKFFNQLISTSLFPLVEHAVADGNAAAPEHKRLETIKAFEKL